MRKPNADITLGPTQTRSNQETLGNGCVCEHGCEACDRLAEAFTRMQAALERARHSGLLQMAIEAPDIYDECSEALSLARKVRP